jgi:hypothetical protein
MKTARTLVFVVGVSAAILGCEGTFVGPYDLDELTFELSVVGGEPIETTIAGGVGTITLRSFHATPMCGYELAGSVAQGNEGLEVHVEARFVGGIAVACYYTYEAVVSGIPEGRHAITLVHRVEGGMGDAPVAEAVVRVR